jgi:hypothetical protein
MTICAICHEDTNNETYKKFTCNHDQFHGMKSVIIAQCADAIKKYTQQIAKKYLYGIKTKYFPQIFTKLYIIYNIKL